jgi:hypothetical protein
MRKNALLLVLHLLSFVSLRAQKTTDEHYNPDSIYYKLNIDEFVVRDTRLDVNGFIKKMQRDETFFRAFRHLRRKSYTSVNDIRFFDKRKQLKAAYVSQTAQQSDGNCRTMQTLQETVEGNFFDRKRNFNYYTAAMFDRLFLTHERICEGDSTADTLRMASADSRIGNYINQLKKLIFRPGERIDLPFLGNKTEIFSPRMVKYYDYSLTAEKYKGQTDCYVFRIAAKPEVAQSDKVVVKYLETFFDKSNFQILGRNYQLKYANMLFQFDVKMQIELQQIRSGYVPSFIRYEGEWSVPLKPKERCIFSTKMLNFK